MDYQVILKELAPCGLDCSRCFAYSEGETKRLSTELLAALGKFERVTARLAGLVPALQHYPEFKEVLVFFTRGSCPGCRSGGGQFPPCSARLRPEPPGGAGFHEERSSIIPVPIRAWAPL